MERQKILYDLNYYIDKDELVIIDEKYINNCKKEKKLKLIEKFGVKINTKKDKATISLIKPKQHKKIFEEIIKIYDISDIEFNKFLKEPKSKLKRASSDFPLFNKKLEIDCQKENPISNVISKSTSNFINEFEEKENILPLSPLTQNLPKNDIFINKNRKELIEIKKRICNILFIPSNIKFDEIVFN